MRALALVLLAGCTVQPYVVPPSVQVQRAQILEREIAWGRDTIPLLRFRVPFVYGAWRIELEQCSGLTREGWPSFYVAPVSPLPGSLLGYYDEGAKAVVFALGNEARKQTVLHELLHFFLAPTIDPRRQPDETGEERVARLHPADYFTGRCGQLLYPAN